MLRVVTLGSATGKFGGPFDTAVLQAEILASRGFFPELAYGYLRNDRPHILPSISSLEAEVRSLTPGERFSTMFSLGIAKAIWRGVETSNIVHISLGRDMVPVFALLAARLRKRPITVQPHGMLTSRTTFLHEIVDYALRAAIPADSSFLALTDVEAEQLRHWLRSKTNHITIVGNPTLVDASDKESLRGTARDSNVYFIARLNPRKRLDIFLRAAAHAHAQGWQERYIVIGPDGGEVAKAREAARSQANVEYVGALPAASLPSIVAGAGVFMLPSADEPWGNVLALALDLHTPVVVARSGALAPRLGEIDGRQVVEDGDSESFARQAHDLLVSPESVPYGTNAKIVPSREDIGVALENAYMKAGYVFPD